ncbi:MAG: hypothetical protein JWO15_3552 [Sphingomonadales bacterium]|nr:hypothetical protein [Sphingomonadales bacterium]
MIQFLATLQNPWQYQVNYPETKGKLWAKEFERGNLYIRFISLEVTLIW